MERVPKEVDALVVKLYQEGIQNCEIGKRSGVSLASVWRILQRNGVTTDRVTGPRNKICMDDAFFDCIDQEKKAYWLGFIAADGSVRKNVSGSFEFSLRLSGKDLTHLMKFRDHIGSSHKIKKGICVSPLVREYHSYSSLRIVRKRFTDALIKLGIVQNKTLVLKFCEVPKNLINHFMRGYFDGDGSVSIRKKRNSICFSVCCASLEFLSKYQEILDINCGVGRNEISSYKRNKVRRISYEGARKIKKIFDFLYLGATVFLDRKKKVFDRYFSLKDGLASV